MYNTAWIDVASPRKLEAHQVRREALRAHNIRLPGPTRSHPRLPCRQAEDRWTCMSPGSRDYRVAAALATSTPSSTRRHSYHLSPLALSPSPPDLCRHVLAARSDCQAHGPWNSKVCLPPVDREDPGPVSSLTATTTTFLESALHHARLPPLHSLSPRSRRRGAATLTTHPPASTCCRPHSPPLTLSQPELCVRYALGPPKSQHLGIGEVLVRCSVPYHDTLLVSNCEVSEQAEQPSSDCRHLGTDDIPEGRGARTASTWMSTMHSISTDRERTERRSHPLNFATCQVTRVRAQD
ncbi:hypothetical protein CERSUDRAFT_96367 [Gelatoporia subvermispora B]|uniref:Uncharacterized protein n=1 Tax=Ceriporiopsis subvermispora (strain B) TaxID=914234 RepID=M2RCK4_CERS8|nr:hypothetical protein CERSUDRAFT_96367 [Gelatoporia subvermispora B]